MTAVPSNLPKRGDLIRIDADKWDLMGTYLVNRVDPREDSTAVTLTVTDEFHHTFTLVVALNQIEIIE